MEMYADEDARGGVLEPEGIVNIKYRRDKQLETMARLDQPYKELKESLADKSLTQDKISDIKVKITEREQLLLPVYTQIAIQFADLHDRAGRMRAKGTIRQPLRWRESRRFFYWRLRRRLNEEYILKKMNGAGSSNGVRGLASSSSSSSSASRDRNLQTLKAWSAVPNFDRDDRVVAMWYEDNRKEIYSKVELLRQDGVAQDVAALIRGNKEGGLKGVAQVLSMLPLAEKESVLKFLSSQ